MSQLASIRRGRTPKSPRLIVYGTEGIGKSTFAAGAPKPVFVLTEGGLDEIDRARFPLANAYVDVCDALAELPVQPF
jgi:AAA domain